AGRRLRGAEAGGAVADQPHLAVAVARAAGRAIGDAGEPAEIADQGARAVPVVGAVGAAVVHALLTRPAQLRLPLRLAAEHAGVGRHVARLLGAAVGVGEAADVLLTDLIGLVAAKPVGEAASALAERDLLLEDAQPLHAEPPHRTVLVER